MNCSHGGGIITDGAEMPLSTVVMWHQTLTVTVCHCEIDDVGG